MTDRLGYVAGSDPGDPEGFLTKEPARRQSGAGRER